MSDVHFTLKHGALGPSLDATLTSGDGVAQDLTGATVTFTLRRVRDNALVIGAAAVTIVSAGEGRVSYDWQSDGPGLALMTPGMYRGEFHITGLNPSGVVWPSDGYIYVEVQPSPNAGS